MTAHFERLVPAGGVSTESLIPSPQQSTTTTRTRGEIVKIVEIVNELDEEEDEGEKKTGAVIDKLGTS